MIAFLQSHVYAQAWKMMPCSEVGAWASHAPDRLSAGVAPTTHLNGGCMKARFPMHRMRVVLLLQGEGVQLTRRKGNSLLAGHLDISSMDDCQAEWGPPGPALLRLHLDLRPKEPAWQAPLAKLAGTKCTPPQQVGQGAEHAGGWCHATLAQRTCADGGHPLQQLLLVLQCTWHMSCVVQVWEPQSACMASSRVMHPGGVQLRRHAADAANC